MVNKSILIGNVGKDPEINHLESGVIVASFSLATTENYKNKAGEKVSTTQWHKIVFWNKPAEIVEKYVKKGDKLYVEGKITYRTYDNKDGQKVYITEIVGNNLVMLGSKEPDQAQKPEAEKESEPKKDTLPF